MTRLRALMVLSALTLPALASAQRVVFPNGTYDLQACYGVEQGTKCDFLYTPLEERRMIFEPRWFVAVAVDGRNVPAQVLSVANSKWEAYPAGIATFRNVPVKVSALFPVQATTFPVVTVAGSAMRGIPVGAGGVPVQAPAAPPSVSAYDAVLTNCAAQSGGALVCTATLTPRR